MGNVLGKCCGCNKWFEKGKMIKLNSGAYACMNCLNNQAKVDREIIARIEGIFDAYGIEERNRSKLLEAYSKVLGDKYGNKICFVVNVGNKYIQ